MQKSEGRAGMAGRGEGGAGMAGRGDGGEGMHEEDSGGYAWWLGAGVTSDCLLPGPGASHGPGL